MLQAPFKLWPWYVHAALASCVVALIGGGAGLWIKGDRIRLSTAQMRSADLDAQLAQLPDTAKSVSDPKQPNFAPIKVSDDVARDIVKFAQNSRIQISALGVDRRHATASEWGYVSFSVNAVGTYPDAKAWMGSLLDRYASLAVQNLHVVGSATTPQMQDIRLTLVLYVQDN